MHLGLGVEGLGKADEGSGERAEGEDLSRRWGPEPEFRRSQQPGPSTGRRRRGLRGAIESQRLVGVGGGPGRVAGVGRSGAGPADVSRHSLAPVSLPESAGSRGGTGRGPRAVGLGVEGEKENRGRQAKSRRLGGKFLCGT